MGQPPTRWGGWGGQCSEVSSVTRSQLDSVLLCLSCPQSNKVPVVQHPHHVHPLTPLITYSNEHFTPGNPPPHLPADVDPKTGRPCTWYQEGVLGLGPSHLLGRDGGQRVGAPVPLLGAEKKALWGGQSLMME